VVAAEAVAAEVVVAVEVVEVVVAVMEDAEAGSGLDKIGGTGF
jgi:hypothetical protein